MNFNPKAGLFHDLNQNQSVYVSFAWQIKAK